MLNVANSPFMLSVLKLNVIMLSVVAPPLLYTANLPYYLVKQSCVIRVWAKIGKLANFPVYHFLPTTINGFLLFKQAICWRILPNHNYWVISGWCLRFKNVGVNKSL